jgi:hypothetical protein
MRIKHFIFDNHLFILILLLILAICMKIVLNLDTMKLFVPIIGGLLSLLYFVQKQQLAELLVFKDLFDDFNCKYDTLNGDLLSIINDTKKVLGDNEKETLISYFNLCGEEYFYYKKGYIYPQVWDSWFKGMSIYYANDKIRVFWNEELDTNSYYGIKKLFFEIYK